jgi:hypothetical protein
MHGKLIEEDVAGVAASRERIRRQADDSHAVGEGDLQLAQRRVVEEGGLSHFGIHRRGSVDEPFAPPSRLWRAPADRMICVRPRVSARTSRRRLNVKLLPVCRAQQFHVIRAGDATAVC